MCVCAVGNNDVMGYRHRDKTIVTTGGKDHHLSKFTISVVIVTHTKWLISHDAHMIGQFSGVPKEIHGIAISYGFGHKCLTNPCSYVVRSEGLGVFECLMSKLKELTCSVN